MARYWIDLDDPQILDAFTIRVNEGDSLVLSVIEDADGIKSLSLDQPLSNRRSFVSYDPAGQVSDCDILFQGRVTVLGIATLNSLGVAGRQAGSTANDVTAFGGHLRGDFANWRAVAYDDGSFNSLGEESTPAGDSTEYHWRRVTISGQSLKLKAWAGDLADEPELPQIDTTSSIVTTPGRVSLFVFSPNQSLYRHIGIGTNGDPAPTGPVGGGDDLLADDIQSTSETGIPSLGQTHSLASVGAESVTSTSSPSITQTHALTADSTESSSELTAPSLDSASTVDSLNAEDISSATETGSPAIGQAHSLAANDAESSSETGSPDIQQTHGLTSVNISSLSTVSSPSLTEVAGTDSLLANDVECQSETGAPALSQAHALQPDNVQSGSEIPSPVIGQIHAITATGVSSASEVTSPVLRDASQVLVTPIRNTKATVVQTTYKAAIIQTVYKAEAG